jgi:dihydrofolate reductase
MEMRKFAIVVAATAGSHGIGRGGSLPWHLPADMAFFKEVTSNAKANSQNVVIMGRKTWEVLAGQLSCKFNVNFVEYSRFLPNSGHCRID